MAKGADQAMEQQPFKVSTGLKDLIGRDLIVDDYVAVFELVKNSFDAHASHVRIVFEDDRIVIADDGKGMSHDDILRKWLFVAYSAKREGTEDDDYRDKIGDRTGPFAGAKGVGRFSCDRLGTSLRLSSKAASGPVQVLDIDWLLYEGDPKREFGDVLVNLSETDDFDDGLPKPSGETGTVLEIRNLRSKWDRIKLQGLKRELTKLIDPFADGAPKFQIEIVAPSERKADAEDAAFNAQRREDQQARLEVNGRIENPIIDVVAERTTSIQVRLVDSGASLETTLTDRGDVVYKIRESNPYEGLADTDLDADIYFLNHSAKMVFKYRMGLPSVQFGSIFLFRNGFRVFPIGAEEDDFFGLNRRKQQGQRRFLGGRDLIGRVQIKGVAGFDEATSRNQGLIRTPEVDQLVECIRDKCVRRLERYVVDISWKDKLDKEADDTSRMRLDESSSRISQLVARLAATEGVELLSYNPNLVRIVDEKSEAFEGSLKALELLADEVGDPSLSARVSEAKARLKILKAAEAEAREAERRAEARAVVAEKAAAVAEVQYQEERARSAFLVAAGSLDQDTILNLHHQIIMQASDVHHGVKRMMGKLRSGAEVKREDWIDFLEKVSFRNSQILTAARFATKGGYQQQASDVRADLAVYVRDYIETVSSLWAPQGLAVHVETDDKPFTKKFRPIEIGIVIDNLVTNAAKARASNMKFFIGVTRGTSPELTLTVADDGGGWAKKADLIERVFEKGVTTTDGSGLGLYHVRQVVESLGGAIEAHKEAFSDELDGAHLTIRVPS